MPSLQAFGSLRIGLSKSNDEDLIATDWIVALYWLAGSENRSVRIAW